MICDNFRSCSEIFMKALLAAVLRFKEAFLFRAICSHELKYRITFPKVVNYSPELEAFTVTSDFTKQRNLKLALKVDEYVVDALTFKRHQSS